MKLKLGIFTVPDATDPAATVEQILAAERAGRSRRLRGLSEIRRTVGSPTHLPQLRAGWLV